MICRTIGEQEGQVSYKDALVHYRQRREEIYIPNLETFISVRQLLDETYTNWEKDAERRGVPPQSDPSPVPPQPVPPQPYPSPVPKPSNLLVKILKILFRNGEEAEHWANAIKTYFLLIASIIFLLTLIVLHITGKLNLWEILHSISIKKGSELLSLGGD